MVGQVRGTVIDPICARCGVAKDAHVRVLMPTYGKAALCDYVAFIDGEFVVLICPRHVYAESV